MFSNFYSRAKTNFLDYPRPFRVLLLSSFVDRMGGALLFPFFAIYVTSHFNVGMKAVGILFFIWHITGMLGRFISGALTDRWGRKKMLLFGLISSALTTLGMAFIDDLTTFYIMAIFVGLVGDTGHPAQQAMIADLLPEEKRAEGFAMRRVINNAAMAIGPAIGGFIAGYSYLFIFLADVVTSLLTAVIVILWIPETKPEQPQTQEKKEETIWQTYAGYLGVFKDGAFISFMLTMIMIGLVYTQMYSTLSVFLVEIHGEPAATYGIILSINAALVVFAQFGITKFVSKRAPMLVLVSACLFYLVGFGMFGFVASFPLFVIAMLLITVGEMLHLPVALGIATKFAPEHMRGRYMAIFGLTFMLPGAVGPYLAGVVMDDFNPFWVWYAASIIAGMAALILVGLHAKQKEAFEIKEDIDTQPAAAD